MYDNETLEIMGKAVMRGAMRMLYRGLLLKVLWSVTSCP